MVGRDINLMALWVHLLLKANWKDGQLRTGQIIKAGQLIIAQRKFADEIGMGRQVLRRCLSNLEKCGNITLKPTQDGTLITICNWGTYQSVDTGIQPTANPQPTHSQPTTNPQPTQEEEEKKKRRKEEKKDTLSFDDDGLPLSPDQLAEGWNRWAGEHGFAKIRKFTAARRAKAKTRLGTDGWLNDYYEVLDRLPLPGEGWQPTFDWLIANDENVPSVLEGKFDWRGGNGQQGPKADPLAFLLDMDQNSGDSSSWTKTAEIAHENGRS